MWRVLRPPGSGGSHSTSHVLAALRPAEATGEPLLLSGSSGESYAHPVDSPPHQRGAIIDYFLSQSPEGTAVHHAEKIASERIYGLKHDVWDVQSSDGRWWVITNPTNLYPQEMTPSRVWTTPSRCTSA